MAAEEGRAAAVVAAAAAGELAEVVEVAVGWGRREAGWRHRQGREERVVSPSFGFYFSIGGGLLFLLLQICNT